MTKNPHFAALLLSLAFALAPALADAKRLGGGNSTGLQRNVPTRSSAETPPAKPAQAAPAAPTPAAAGAAPQAPKRSWLGPLAGIAAGIGIGALMSHFGMGGAFGSFLLIALLAVAGVVVVRMLMRRNSSVPPLGASAAGAFGAAAPTRVAWPPAGASSKPTPAMPAPDAPAAASAAARAAVPAGFDADGFARIAKTIFIRMQAANDSGDLDDLRRFTTPEMFANLRVDLLERSGRAQRTDVLRVDARVLDVADERERQIVSVRFDGQLREEAGAAPVDFDEVWHLVKPRGDDGHGWAIAGIEQTQSA